MVHTLTFMCFLFFSVTCLLYIIQYNVLYCMLTLMKATIKLVFVSVAGVLTSLNLHHAADRWHSQPAGQRGAEPAGPSDGQHEDWEHTKRWNWLSDQPVYYRPRRGRGVSAYFIHLSLLLVNLKSVPTNMAFILFNRGTSVGAEESLFGVINIQAMQVRCRCYAIVFCYIPYKVCKHLLNLVKGSKLKTL